MPNQKLKETGHLQTSLRKISPSITVSDNPKILEPEGKYVWKKVGEIRSGEMVNWWTDVVEVKGVTQKDNEVLITVFDPRSGEEGGERTFSYEAKDELRVKDQSNKT